MGEVAGKVLAALSAALLAFLLVGSTVAIAAPPVVNDPDDDEAIVWIDDIEVDEAAGTATFTISKAGRTEDPISVRVRTEDGTAVSGRDYEETAATITLPRRRIASRTFTVPIFDDALDEDDETFFVRLGEADDDDDVLIDRDTATGTIIDDDTADTLLVSIDGPSTGAIGLPTTFDAVMSGGGEGTSTYEWTVFFQGNPVATGNEASFEFTPDDSGIHIVQAVVSDDQGQDPAEFIEFSVLGDIAASVFAADIVWLANEGITRGCNPPDNDQFCPDKTVTRGQMAAFLVRFLGLTAIDPAIELTDTAGNIFEQDILKLATAGITQGCNQDATLYCPNKAITRSQMAAFLVRAVGLSDGGGNLFDDDDGSVFESDIDKLATAGITRGCNADGTRFCPDKTVTRGQMAAFLHRTADLLP